MSILLSAERVVVWGAEFYEERAVLLGRVGDHEKALAIYTSHVRDRAKAEEYCKRHYDPSKEPNKDVRIEPNVFSHKTQFHNIGWRFVFTTWCWGVL